MTMTANDNAMTMRECIETLLAREDAGQIRLQDMFFDLVVTERTLSEALNVSNFYDGMLFRVAEDGIYHIGEENPCYRIIRAA